MDRENSEVKMEMQRKEQLNEKGLTAYFEQMANADGRVETTVQWLVEISLLIQSEVEKRLKHEALSLFQWKDVADGLPEATGLFIASIKGRGLTITGFAVDSDSDKWRWEDKYDSYIPYPIPECEMTNKQCKEK